MFDRANYLKLYWGSQALVYTATTTWHFFRGTAWDRSASHRHPHETLGPLQFRKRSGTVYVFASATSAWILWNVFSSYYFGSEANGHFTEMLEFFTRPKLISTDETSIVLAGALFQFHILRRLYESFRVNIQSKRQVLSALETVLVYLHYPLAMLSLVAEAPALALDSNLFDWHHLSLVQLLSVGAFGIASYVQYKSHQQMAGLRRNRYGHVTTTDYRIPTGFLFEYASCPHYMAEVLIYFSLASVMHMSNTTWTCVLAFMVCNQYFFARSTHHYYLNKFEDYPKDRKIMIPFLL